MTRQLRVVIAIACALAAVLGATGAAAAPTSPIDRFPVAPSATRDDTPPSRQTCGAGGCSIPAQYRDYEGFLAWTRDDLRGTWIRLFRRAGLTFAPPRSFIVSGDATVASRCSATPIDQDAELGSFYCPKDGPGAVYLPETGLRRLVFESVPGFRLRNYRTRDFAFAVIVAHEWGHHVQSLLGGKARAFRLDGPRIRVELQADCLAGIWAKTAWRRALLDATDIPEALRLASSAGDRPEVAPGDPQAHGTAAQRRRWFSRGYDEGRIGACDTSRVPLA